MDSNVGQTDVAASREAREQMDDTLWWKPQTGEGNRWADNFIRILPAHKTMAGKFYLGIPLHFRVGPGNAIVPCPRKAFGEACPICVRGFELQAGGKQQEGGDMLPSWRAYVNVVPLDSNGEPEGENPKVRVFEASKTVLDEILDIMESPKYGDVTSLERGHNINIRKRVIGNDPKKHTRYQVAAATEATAFDHPELVNGLHDLGKISPYRSADVLAGLLEGEARKDPFAAVEAPEDKPAITGPVQQPGGMSFEAPPDDEQESTEAESGPSVAAAGQTMEEAQAALRESIAAGKAEDAGS